MLPNLGQVFSVVLLGVRNAIPGRVCQVCWVYLCSFDSWIRLASKLTIFHCPWELRT